MHVKRPFSSKTIHVVQDTISCQRQKPSSLFLEGEAVSNVRKFPFLEFSMFFSWLTEKGVLAMNPAREVQTPRFSRTEGKTPAPPTEEVQRLLDGIDITTVIGLRDRALLGVMAYTFARIGAVVSLTKEDYFCPEKRSILRFSEKGGKQKEIPVHHKLEEYLDQYLTAAKLSDDPEQPLFKSTRGRSKKLGSDRFGSQRRLGHAKTTASRCRRLQHLLQPFFEGSRYHQLLRERWLPRSCPADGRPCRLQNYQVVRSSRSTDPRCRRRKSQIHRLGSQTDAFSFQTHRLKIR